MERGGDPAFAHRIAGIGMYGVLMMARRGEMTLDEAVCLFSRMTGMTDGVC